MCLPLPSSKSGQSICALHLGLCFSHKQIKGEKNHLFSQISIHAKIFQKIRSRGGMSSSLDSFPFKSKRLSAFITSGQY